MISRLYNLRRSRPTATPRAARTKRVDDLAVGQARRRQLGGDTTQEVVALGRRQERGGVSDGGELSIR
jgi:hypothetical protein